MGTSSPSFLRFEVWQTQYSGVARIVAGNAFGDWGPWALVSALRSGNVSVTVPAEPVVVDPDPVEPEVEAPADDSDELAQLRATVSALRDSLRNAGAGGTTTVTLIDTVEVARVDTLHYCPPTDEDRQDLFDAFTGLQDSTGGAGKAAVRVESWGAIKVLVREE